MGWDQYQGSRVRIEGQDQGAGSRIQDLYVHTGLEVDLLGIVSMMHKQNIAFEFESTAQILFQANQKQQICFQRH